MTYSHHLQSALAASAKRINGNQRPSVMRQHARLWRYYERATP